MEKDPATNSEEPIKTPNYDRICDTCYISTPQVWVTGLSPLRKLLPEERYSVQRVRRFKAETIDSIALNPDELTGRIKHGRKITRLEGPNFEVYYEYIHPENPKFYNAPHFKCFRVIQDPDDLT